jgi:exopolysaccharide production protein ExoY
MSFDSEFAPECFTSGKRDLDQLLKRLFDIVVAASSLILLSPLFLLIALIVLIIEGRPVIFRHRRLTVDAKDFGCLKFRSMVRDADDRLKLHLLENPRAASEWEKNRKLSQDPRITRFGAFLRTSSLDELPQLVNILRGEMSLVGPRPIVADELSRYGENAHAYLSVRPGLTGLWQVSGRNDCSFDERIQLDVDYVHTRSFSNDLMIVLRTFSVVMSRRGSL